MGKRLGCILVSLVMILSLLCGAATAAADAEVNSSNPLLSDWSKAEYTYSAKGKKKAEKAVKVPQDAAGKVMKVKASSGEWSQMITTEDGDYSFSVDTDQISVSSMEIMVWRYRDDESGNNLKQTDTLHYDVGNGIVTRVIHDVYAGETLYWYEQDSYGSKEYLLMISPGDNSQAKQEVTWELEEGGLRAVAGDDGLNGQPIISETPRAGDKILMGWYEQDFNYDNGRERIEWTVLEVNEKKDQLLVISSKALDCILYHPSRIVVKWEDSYIRGWLNFDFAMTSLSSSERACIVSQKVAGDWDTVTMLDAKQIKKYKLAKNGCFVTPYATYKDHPVNVAEDNGRGCWWVRENKTRSGGWTSFVGRHGKVYKTNYTTSGDNGVRPAMMLSISALKNCLLGPDFSVMLGEVVDASNPTRKLGGATVTVGDRSAISDQRGRFVMDLDVGDYAYSATRNDYINASGTFTLRPGNQTVYTIPMCRKMAENEYRVVLTWGLNPADLDSHLSGMAENGSGYHVYYVQLQADGGNALLEWDDTTSYGPETTHFLEYSGASYTFSVHDYTNRGSSSSDRMARSGAKVVVYHADSEMASFDVPDEPGTVWTVFTVQNNQLTPVNRMSYCSNPQQVR